MTEYLEVVREGRVRRTQLLHLSLQANDVAKSVIAILHEVIDTLLETGEFDRRPMRRWTSAGRRGSSDRLLEFRQLLHQGVALALAQDTADLPYLGGETEAISRNPLNQ